MSATSGGIIDQIDAGHLRPRSHAVVGSLAAHLKLSPLGAEVLEAFKQGTSVGNEGLIDRIWNEIENLPPEQQGGRRVLVQLLHPDAPIDGYEAGYLVSWAESEGVPSEAIWTAFQSS